MRILKVLGLLLVVSAVCKLLLTVIGGSTGLVDMTDAEQLGQAVGGALVIFFVAAITAGISAYIRRGHGLDYPGLGAGAVAAVAVTGLMLAGQS